MKSTSLESGFICRAGDALLLKGKDMAEAEQMLDNMPFDDAYDLVCVYMRQALDDNTADEAISLLKGFALKDSGEENITKHAALMQVVAAALIELGDTDGALEATAGALRILEQEPKRKDEPFRCVLASLLYDLAFIHAGRKEYSAAERSLDKAIKMFDKLAKEDPLRYAGAHVHALNAATSVFRSRIKQVNLLAHYQVATSTYLSMAGTDAPAAVYKLVESLTNEASTLIKLGKTRDAVRYLTRALRYLAKLEPDFSMRQLELSVMLGDALLHTVATRQKGIHLLNTLLPKAKKMKADAMVARIDKLLDERHSSMIDILSLWHKVFPRN